MGYFERTVEWVLGHFGYIAVLALIVLLIGTTLEGIGYLDKEVEYKFDYVDDGKHEYIVINTGKDFDNLARFEHNPECIYCYNKKIILGDCW